MKHSKTEVAEARARLLEWIKPGDTVYTILRNVSRSGMSREIGVVLMQSDPSRGCVDLHPNHAVSVVLGERLGKRDGVIVGGCGMDMGFHLVNSLGYALWGELARSGEGPEANALREAIYRADPHYYHQGDKHAALPPDFTKPDQFWFGASDYALKHRWL